MQNNGIIFSSYEQEIMQDTRFFLTKREVLEKTEILLSKFQRSIDKSQHRPKPLERKLGIAFQGPKISKGENFHGLPYQVLDHPRYFTQEGVISFRSMFWWGQHWSFTLHVQGGIWERRRERLTAEQLNLSIPVYLGTGSENWEYDYSEEHFRLFPAQSSASMLEALQNAPFLKLGNKIPVSACPDEILKFGFDVYHEAMDFLVRA